MRQLAAVICALALVFTSCLFAQQDTTQRDRRPDQQFFTLPGIEFSKEQQAKVEAIRKVFLPKLTENQREWNGVITEEQLRARREAFQKARDAGKEGPELRDAVDKAVKLTAEQQKQQATFLEERNKLVADIRTQLMALLTEEQQARLRQPQRVQEQIPPTHADVKYGPHDRNVMDVWLAKSDKLTPQPHRFRSRSRNFCTLREM